jgi:hypothetical protein
MIHINLLRTAPHKRKPFSIPVAAFIRPLLVVVTVAAVAALCVGGIRWWRNRPVQAPVAAVHQEKNSAKETPDTPEPTKTPVATGFGPSTHVQQNIVEEVVADVDAPARQEASSALAELSYNEMSRGERINYEFSFARNVLQILTRAVPDGIGFSSFSIDSFQKVSASGLAPGRALVTSLFANLRRERFALSNPPQSYIRSSGDQGFRFSFTCEVPLGTNPTEPWLLTDHCESRQQLGTDLKSFAESASRSGVFLAPGLTHVKTYKSARGAGASITCRAKGATVISSGSSSR